jgi:hypothetical protein
MSVKNRGKPCGAHVIFTIINGTVGHMGVFRKGPILNDDLHGKRCSRPLIQRSGCSILLHGEEYFTKELEKNMDQHRADERILKYKLEAYQKNFLDFICGNPTNIEVLGQDEET